MQQAQRHFTSIDEAFIYHDWLLHANQVIQQDFILLWTAQDCIILGMNDTFEPQFKKGLQTLPYPYVLRSSGGRAIVNDEGIINVSLYYTGQDRIEEAYQKMVRLLESLCHVSFEVGEVTGSYCPGAFDLSRNGKKVAGLSQRRYKDSIVVMAYLSLEGNQEKRGQWLETFYHVAESDMVITPSTMTTLSSIKKENIQHHLHQLYEPLEIAPWIQFHLQHPELKDKIMTQWQRRQQLLED